MDGPSSGSDGGSPEGGPYRPLFTDLPTEYTCLARRKGKVCGSRATLVRCVFDVVEPDFVMCSACTLRFVRPASPFAYVMGGMMGGPDDLYGTIDLPCVVDGKKTSVEVRVYFRDLDKEYQWGGPLYDR